MSKNAYRSMPPENSVDRRDFFKLGGAVGAGLLLSGRTLLAADEAQDQKPAAKPASPPPRPKTNIEDAMKAPRTKYSLPGLFPGQVVEVRNDGAMPESKPDAAVIKDMVEKGVRGLTGKDPKASFDLFFTPADIVGIKVNPVGAGLISTRLEVVDALIAWLEAGGLPRKNIVIWDRFDTMLIEAGYTAERFPGVRIEGLQTIDEAVADGKSQDTSKWLRPDGHHVSEPNFDMDVFYWADVEGPKGLDYLTQHVFNGKHSYFGKLLTKTLTKIINVPVFKNTGNGVSMATKNMGYGAVCNTNRLHRPLFFDVCTEVLAFPCVRDKMVLNVTDGLRGQYDGGPGPNAKFAFLHNRLHFATDPFALDMVCHNQLVAIRKEKGVQVNENPRWTEYLRYAEKLGLGIADPAKIKFTTIG